MWIIGIIAGIVGIVYLASRGTASVSIPIVSSCPNMGCPCLQPQVLQSGDPCACPNTGTVANAGITLTYNAPDNASMEITNDVSTWPSGDPYWTIAQAIALAEGANVAGSNPDRLNNPGDISDGATQFGSESHSGSSVTAFPDKQTGWNWLYAKLKNINNGSSKTYNRNMTWNQIAQKWAGDWQDWVTNVTSYLGVSPTSTFADYVNS